MKALFVITHDDNDKPVIHRTPATDDLLAKLSKKGGQFGNYSGFEDSKDLALALSIGTPLSAFTEIAGNVPLDQVPEAEFLETMGADGIDMFY
jgi:hypothetical protein